MKRKLLALLSLLASMAVLSGCTMPDAIGSLIEKLPDEIVNLLPEGVRPQESTDGESSTGGESSEAPHEHAFTELHKDADGHWYTCECGEEQDKVAHSGGEATCTEQAECSVCGEAYGSKAMHSYTELKHDADGHWYECECGDAQDKATHGGGNATCTEKGECAYCGEVYGELAAHNYEAKVGYFAATAVETGKYVIEADGYLAGALGSSKTYGYLYGDAHDETAGYFATAKAGNVFTITVVDGGYTIQDRYDRYLYNTGDYRTFSLAASDSEVTEDMLWAIVINEDGTATITDVSTGRTVGQGEGEYTSFGVYPEGTEVAAPTLYKWESNLVSDETHHWYTCQGCGVAGEKVAHVYDVAMKSKDGHWNECVCGVAESAPVAHTFDIEKSDEEQHWTECACGWYSTKVDHEFDNLKYDAESHWYACDCGLESEKEVHKGGEAACTGAAVCEVCNQPYGSVGEHFYNVPNKDDTHHWNECGCGVIDESSKVAHTHEAKFDDNNHWEECACGHKINEAAHSHEGKFDESKHWEECACGHKINEAAHVYGDWKTTDEKHWKECECGAISEEAAHNGGEASCTEKAVCADCGNAYGELKAHEHTELKHDAEGHWYECECGDAEEKASHSGGEASCTEKAKCEVCGEEHGELKAHEYTILDTSDASVDKVACACGAIDENYAFDKVIEDRQEVALYGETVALSLAGISEYTAVKKIYVVKTTGANVDGEWVTTREEISLGTDITALDVTNLEKALHGENEVIVVVEDAKGEHTVAVPVLLITGEISTADEWRAAVQTSTATGATYGYYVLTANISLAALGNNGGNPAAITVNTSGSVGFLGTVDGKGFDVRTEASWWTNGHFGALGAGAVLKNISFTQTNSLYYGWNRFILGRVAVGTTFENVTFNLKNQTAISGGETNADNNPLAYDGFMNCTFKNVVVNVENSSITSLFGGCSKWFGLHNTTFENCQVKLDSKSTMMEIGHKKDSSTEEITVYTAEGWPVEGATVLEGITVTQEAAKIEATLAHQDIILSGSTYALNLGEYADYTISSIKLGDYDLGTNASALAIPDEIKNDLTKHGAATVVVNASKGAVQAALTIPVTLVTKAISTMQDLNTTVACVDADIYGYYILTNNVSFSEEGFVAVTDAKRGWASTVAFRGTLDGRGYTVAANSSQWGNVGLFGTMNGATVKNITLTDGWNNGSALIAYAAYNVTFTDVTIEIKNGKANAGTAGSMSLFANAFGGNGSFTNVKITTAIDMPVLLPGMTAWIKFNDVTVIGNVTNLSLTTGYESFDAVSGITVNAAA